MPVLVGALLIVGSRTGGTPPPQLVGFLTWPMVGVQFLLLPFVGGFAFRVDSSGVTVMLGLLRIPIKRLPWSSIESIAVVPDIRPLDDFRGYGWRTNPATRKTAYILSSGDAVQVASGGWNYLLIMPNPNDFAAAAVRWKERITHHPPP